MKYEFLEHTADAKFRAYGKNLEEAFSNAVLAVTALMTDIKKVKPVLSKKVTIEAKKKESLLFDFLQELLFLLDTEQLLVGAVKNLKIKAEKDKFVLTAELLGENAKNHVISAGIKAITYNDMFIKEEKNKVTVQVVADL